MNCEADIVLHLKSQKLRVAIRQPVLNSFLCLPEILPRSHEVCSGFVRDNFPAVLADHRKNFKVLFNVIFSSSKRILTVALFI